ncbi:trihelix transcription factor ENAP1-like isoform X1 [Musa acuminata AAA Group]|uniref:trihelix transcription factor ENAP1-like isoform X1 n=1 Tax=Musa acuminata AAA Group TaxID=214697 RepID=UPI0031DBD8FF
MEGREVAPSRPPNPAMPYREDCWSEGETSALVDAWGDRYIELNRGNLRQKDWQEVADSVNSRRGAGRRPPRTDVQCKNRIDTLKKKYKVEKARITSGGAESQWPFFSRLDALIGSASAPAVKKAPASPPLALPLPFHRRGTPLPAAAAVRSAEPREKRQVASEFPVDNPFFRRAAAAAAAAAEDDEDDEEEEVEGSDSLSRSSSKLGRGLKRGREGEGNGIRELAKAITRFAEIYERVEESKQKQMMELEKQRMEFAKALEFQKMQIFVDSQLQLAKIKRVKRSDTVICSMLWFNFISMMQLEGHLTAKYMLCKLTS